MSPTDLELLKAIYEFFDEHGDGAPDSSAEARRMLNWTGPLQRLIDREQKQLRDEANYITGNYEQLPKLHAKYRKADPRS